MAQTILRWHYSNRFNLVPDGANLVQDMHEPGGEEKTSAPMRGCFNLHHRSTNQTALEIDFLPLVLGVAFKRLGMGMGASESESRVRA